MILNTSNCFGRITSGYIAAVIGVPNLMIVAITSGAMVILGMIGLNSLTSVVVIGLAYGYFAGVCKYFHRDESVQDELIGQI